nr:MAG TPA: hypothetical protein [Caudoviricetes sp.]
MEEAALIDSTLLNEVILPINICGFAARARRKDF